MKKRTDFYKDIVNKATEIEVAKPNSFGKEIVPVLIPEPQFMTDIGNIIRRDFHMKPLEEENFLENEHLNGYLDSHITPEDHLFRENNANDNSKLWKTSQISSEANQISTLFLPKSAQIADNNHPSLLPAIMNESSLLERHLKSSPIEGYMLRKKKIDKSKKVFPENAHIRDFSKKRFGLLNDSGKVNRQKTLRKFSLF